jgi:hypothetical protein
MQLSPHHDAVSSYGRRKREEKEEEEKEEEEKEEEEKEEEEKEDRIYL